MKINNKNKIGTLNFMLNYLKNCSTNTPIGLLPSIINHNNEAIDSEFSWIYDASLNRLTKSVYAPTGSVKAHFGEFVNLSAEYITIKNVDSLKNTLYEAVSDIIGEDLQSHLTLNDTYSNDDTAAVYKDTSFCHDAGVIAIGSLSLLLFAKTTNSSIDYLDSTVDDLSTQISNIKKTGIYSAGANIDITDNKISALGYTYNASTKDISTAGDIKFVANSSNYAMSDLMSLIAEMEETINQQELLIQDLTKRVEALEEGEDQYKKLAVEANNLLTTLTGDTTTTTEADYTKEVYDEANSKMDTLIGK